MAEEATEGAAANPEGQTTEGAAANPEATASETTTDVSWREQITDERVRKQIDRFTDIPSLAKSYVELNSEFSQRIKVPGEDASEEDVAKFRKALGVPESVDQYKLTRPEYMDEDTFMSDEVQEEFQDFVKDMHQVGLTQQQLDRVLSYEAQRQQNAAAKLAQNDARHMEEGEAKLRAEWGADYDANKAFSEQAAAYYPFGNDLVNAQLANGMLLGNDPNFVRLLADVGRMKGEGQLQAGMRGTEGGADLQQRYDELSSQIYAAYEKGDTDTAKRLDAQRAQISERLNGTGPIPGRAA